MPTLLRNVAEVGIYNNVQVSSYQ